MKTIKNILEKRNTENNYEYKCIERTHKNWKHYLIHDNGARPYCVYISDKNKIDVYKVDKNLVENENDYGKPHIYTKLIVSYEAEKIFIGESPLNEMTEFSLGYGPNFDGNSILVYLNDNKYVFIGSKIYSFKTTNPIVKFVSPVGNSDVPYPYAIDTEENYYFLIAYGILKVEDKSYESNPYIYYYKKLKEIKESENVEHMIIKGDQFWIDSHPDPEKDYDDLTRRIGKPIYIKKNNGDKKKISKNEYIELLTNYNKKIGLTPILDVQIIDEKKIYIF